MVEKSSGPSSDYYENPWVPTYNNLEEWSSVELRPVEALHILVQAASNGQRLSPIDEEILGQIRDGDSPQDFVAIRNRLIEEYERY